MLFHNYSSSSSYLITSCSLTGALFYIYVYDWCSANTSQKVVHFRTYIIPSSCMWVGYINMLLMDMIWQKWDFSPPLKLNYMKTVASSFCVTHSSCLLNCFCLKSGALSCNSPLDRSICVYSQADTMTHKWISPIGVFRWLQSWLTG